MRFIEEYRLFVSSERVMMLQDVPCGSFVQFASNINNNYIVREKNDRTIVVQHAKTGWKYPVLPNLECWIPRVPRNIEKVVCKPSY